MSVELNTAVPDFTLAASGGQTITLSALAGKNVVLYFYPKDDTPGCTLEGTEFTQNLSAFAAANTVVLGVSRDSVASHDKFCQKYDYRHVLLADVDSTLCNSFGVIKEKNMYGKKVIGIERSTFLINNQGVLVQQWRGVRVPGHVEAVLAAAQALN